MRGSLICVCCQSVTHNHCPDTWRGAVFLFNANEILKEEEIQMKIKLFLSFIDLVQVINASLSPQLTRYNYFWLCFSLACLQFVQTPHLWDFPENWLCSYWFCCRFFFFASLVCEAFHNCFQKSDKKWIIRWVPCRSYSFCYKATTHLFLNKC